MKNENEELHKFKRIHIRTEADMDKLWKTYGKDCFHLGDKGIILVEHTKRRKK
tara:strand:+ start:517 stop:675 length:159 start_codon:yes stop_codon:yes gene_type:complete